MTEDAQRRKVLVVDDDAGVRAYLLRLLASWDYTASAAADANEALAAMTAEPASIVLCDVRMPERNGLWLAEQLLARWPSTAIIMATGYDDAVLVQSSRKLGAVAYITKPFDLHQLRQAVDHAAGRLRFRPSAEP